MRIPEIRSKGLNTTGLTGIVLMALHLTNMINGLQIRNIQIEAIIADRLDDFSKEEKEQVKQDAESLYGKL